MRVRIPLIEQIGATSSFPITRVAIPVYLFSGYRISLLFFPSFLTVLMKIVDILVSLYY